LSKLFDPSDLRDAGAAPRDAESEPAVDMVERAAKAALDRILAATVRLPDTLRA
jgi:hypothetical protein